MERLRVADEVRTGYTREAFGSRAPTSATRQKVLAAEATGPGMWLSPWDGRLHTTPTTLQIDHTVALAEAWDSGASTWTKTKRVAFANDLTKPYSLNAITGSLNQSKADKDPSDWMPPFKMTTCRYVNEWTRVKLDWGLSVDAEEKMALHNHARECDR